MLSWMDPAILQQSNPCQFSAIGSANMVEDDTLVRRRSRRSTAGNRYGFISILWKLSERVHSMEAALAELSVEDVKDEADDKDFIIVRGK
jgi:hypothetical protein